MKPISISGNTVIDLSHTIESGIPVPPRFEGPKFEVALSQERGDVANVETIQLGTHQGTHCDAPYHFYTALRGIDELPVDCLIGPAIVVDLTEKRESVPIEAADLHSWEAATGEPIKPHDIVLLHTGHSKHWALKEAATGYWRNGWPYLTQGAVEYLASRPIRAIGVETFDPDWVDPHNLASAEFVAHRAFLSRGILIIENLTNLDRIPGPRCHIIALPLKLKGCSGSPLRVVAIARSGTAGGDRALNQ
jgi:kynurenine formamidase